MAIKFAGREVEMFRCHIDPAIGSRAKNAFSRKEYPMAYFELTPIGIYVRMPYNVPGNAAQFSEHIVPYANVQSVKLIPLEPGQEKLDA